jgi:PAS domain S-box-containing protein
VHEDIHTLKQQLEFILGVTKTGLDIIDSEFNIRYIDPEWAKVYGDPTAKKCYEYFMGRTEVCPGCGIPKALKTRVTAVTEEILVKEGNRPIQVTTIPFQNSRGEWLVAEVNVDITERKRAEETLRKAHDELERRVQEKTAELVQANQALTAEISVRKRAEERLAKLNDCMLRFGADPNANINRLVALCGEQLQSTCALYNRLENGMLHSIGQWHTPPDFSSIDKPDGHICYDVIQSGQNEIHLIRNLPNTIYAQTDPNVMCYQLKTYIGMPVSFEGSFVGSLCVVYQEDYIPTDDDKKLLGIISSAIGVEEERKAAEEALKRSEEAAKWTAQENAAMAEIGRTISSSLDINEIYDHFAEEVNKLIPFDRIVINIINVERGTAVNVYMAGKEIGGRKVGEIYPLQGSGIAEMIRLKSTVLIQVEDSDEYQDRFPMLLSTFQAGFRSVMDVPLLSKGQIIGGLLLRALKPYAYTDRDVRLAEKIGNQIAGAIANVQLFMEHKQTEEMLKESEEKYRTILENIADGYYEVDLAGNFTFFNVSVCHLLGYSKDELLGMNNRQYTDQENSKKLYQAFNKVYRTGIPSQIFDWEIIRKDGAKRYIESSISLIKNPSGQPTGFRGIVRDITERKHAEELLQQESSFRTSIIEAVAEGLCVCHEITEYPHVTFTVWNDRMTEITGYSMDEINRLGWYQTMYPDPETQARAINRMARMRQGDKLVDEEWEITRVNNEKRLLSISTAVLQTNGGVPHVLALMQDITGRKQAENNLRESEERYRNILANIEDGYYEVNLAGDFTFFNDSMCRMLGYARDEMMGMGNKKFTDEENRNKLFLAFNEVYKTGKPTKAFDLETIRKDGAKVIGEVSVSLIKDSNGQPIGFRGIARDVTQRKQAEEALRQSEEKYRTILENMEDGYFEVDITGCFTFFNESLRRMLGYSQDEMIGMNNRQYTDEENAKKLFLAFNRVFRTGEPTKEFDWEIIRKDGAKRYIEASVSLIKNLSGQPAGFRGLVRDITNRKRTEEEIKQTLSLLNATLESTADGILVVDRKGKIESFNQKFVQMWNIPESVMASRDDDQALAFVLSQLKNHEAFLAKVRELYGQTEADSYDLIEFKDGRVFERYSRPQRIGDQTVGRVWSFQDVTDRKQAEEALRQSEERYRLAIESSNDGVAIVQREKHIYVNKQFAKMFGYEGIEEVLDQAPYTWIHPDDRERVMEYNKKRQRGEKVPERYETKGIKKNGETVYLEISATKILLHSEPITLAYLRDITDLKKAEEALRQTEEQLRQSQKMEAVGRLAGGIAHDFNNLLTVIKGYSELSLFALQDEDPLKENINEICKASERAANLTRQLLAFSRKQILDFKVLNINSLIKDLDKMLHRILGEDIELIYNLDENAGKVKTDPGQIEQVILNLAVNARDAMPSGGKLLIETGSVNEMNPPIHSSTIPSGYVRLSITDTGIGMARDVKEHLFEPFFTTKEKGKGTGLGLSTVYGIVKQSGGNVDVSSELGQGTTFNIYLPKVEEKEDISQKEDGRISLLTGDETILLVEDEKPVRELAARILSDRGYQVYSAPDGKEALKLFQDHPNRIIHLLLTDVVMPGMSGREVADHLKLLAPDIKVLFISGYTDDAIVHHGVLNKGVNFVQKPFTPEALVRKVREVLDR